MNFTEDIREWVAWRIEGALGSRHEKRLEPAKSAAWDRVEVSGDEELAEHGLVRLPIDMDGRPIRIGDAVEIDGEAAGEPRVGHVTGIEYRKGYVSLAIAPIGRGYTPHHVHHAADVADDGKASREQDEERGESERFSNGPSPSARLADHMRGLTTDGVSHDYGPLVEPTGEYVEISKSLAGLTVPIGEDVADTIADPKSALASDISSVPGHEPDVFTLAPQSPAVHIRKLAEDALEANTSDARIELNDSLYAIADELEGKQ